MRSDARRSRRPLPVRLAKLVAAALFGLSAAAGMAEELPALIRDAVAACGPAGCCPPLRAPATAEAVLAAIEAVLQGA